MTKTQKDRAILWSSNLAIAVISGLIVLFFNTNDLDARELNRIIESKADKTELEKHEAANIREIDRIRVELNKKANKEVVQMIYQDLTTIKTDIKKLLEEKNGG